MVFCTNCAKTISNPDNDNGKICCPLCGKVLDEDIYSQEPQFVKNSAGQSQMSGNYVRSTQNDISVSRERTLSEALYGIQSIMYALGIDGGDSIANPAVNFYRIALERKFTKGRKKEQVQAACLYTICRERKKPYLLIDFSEHLRTTVYELGGVFLQLCLLLSLGEHPIIRKPVDPSLFIHRFTDRLCGGRNIAVSKTALQIIASMKRDWIQTGRNPSGLCGAALYISALSNGFKCSMSEVRKVVRVCEATLTKRLIEFENTDSGGLTFEEFRIRAAELEKEERLITSLNTGSNGSEVNKLLCEHKNSGRPPFAHGLCTQCYGEFIELSGGLNAAGAEPPAFQRAEMERSMASKATAERSNSDSSALHGQAENNIEPINPDEQRGISDTSGNEVLKSAGSGSTGATDEQKITNDSSKEEILEDEQKTTNDSSKEETLEADANSEESECLSDLDDMEVELYLHNEEEKELRTFIWEKMNREYLEEQAAKEAAEMAKKKAEEELLSSCSGDVQAAQRLAADAAEAVAKSRKEKRQQRAAELKNLSPAKNAHEATKQVLEKKRLSSKIKYDELEKLFSEPLETPDNAKKSRTEQEESDHNDNHLNGNDDYYEDEEPFDYGNDGNDDFDFDYDNL